MSFQEKFFTPPQGNRAPQSVKRGFGREKAMKGGGKEAIVPFRSASGSEFSFPIEIGFSSASKGDGPIGLAIF